MEQPLVRVGRKLLRLRKLAGKMWAGMDQKQYDALLRIPGLRAAREKIDEMLTEAVKEAETTPTPAPDSTDPNDKAKRVMSEAGRAAVALAQTRRWERVRAEKAKEPQPPKSPRAELWTPEKRAEQSRRMKALIKPKESTANIKIDEKQ